MRKVLAIPAPARTNGLIPIILFGTAIAALAPFDIFGVQIASPVWRGATFLLIAHVGSHLADGAGLSLYPKDVRAAAATALWMMIVVVLGVLFLDRGSPISAGLAMRMAANTLHAFDDEILFRLALMSAILWVGLPAWLAIILAQFANVALHLAVPSDPTALFYPIARFVLPGIAWGYLYWRHGFIAALAAHVGSHVLLQPALGARPMKVIVPEAGLAPALLLGAKPVKVIVPEAGLAPALAFGAKPVNRMAPAAGATVTTEALVSLR